MPMIGWLCREPWNAFYLPSPRACRRATRRPLRRPAVRRSVATSEPSNSCRAHSPSRRTSAAAVSARIPARTQTTQAAPPSILNLRIDQSWGFAAISGALQNEAGAYYNNAIQSPNTSMANTLVQGHPGDTYGYAGSIGFTLTDFLGLKGDSLAIQANAAHGANVYVWQSIGTWFQRSGQNVAFSNNFDGVYANGTSMHLADSWSVFGGYEHFWTPKLHSTVWGGIAGVTFGQSAKNLMCAGAPGLGITNGALGFAVPTAVGAPSGFINGWSPGSQCNPNSGLWQAGTRTIWNPHPDLDIGVDVVYSAIQTANRGATVWNGAGATGQPPGLYTFANEGQWTASLRIQRNFLP
jgi:Porin subfamily